MSRILIVDDDEFVRKFLTEALNVDGYRAIPAGSARDALHALGQAPYELALLDIYLPDRNGIEVLREIRERHPDTAVVMVSGAEEIDTVLTTLNLGASDCITKPFGRELVVSRVEQALEKRRLTIEKRQQQRELEQLVKERTEALQRSLQYIEATYDATIKALGGALDLRDSETQYHSERVSLNVLTLARAIGIREPKCLKDLEWGAFLHDIGKIGIPDSILMKPGRLDEEELKIIKTHPSLGARLLQGIPFLKSAAELVQHHHEWYDGSGYPNALKGEQIPLSARLFAVADTIDAITSDRPYRKAQPVGEARKELVRLSGVQYDPQVIQAFLGVPEQEWMDD